MIMKYEDYRRDELVTAPAQAIALPVSGPPTLAPAFRLTVIPVR
jgi:hypothetical protein